MRPDLVNRHGIALLAILVAALGGSIACDEPRSPDEGMDAGAHDAARACTDDGECSDGTFCNGAERCAPAAAGADARGCVAAASPACTDAQTCDEDAARCVGACDADGDGHDAEACGGDDCDDTDRNRYPGNDEVCDTADHDEDCDPETYGVRDADEDDAPDARCCNRESDGVVHCGDDCDDTRAAEHPGQLEACNGRDDDCDGATDEEVQERYTVDEDGDGFGTDDPSAAEVWACRAPSGHGPPGDCDDDDSTIRPTAPERCDPAGIDEDCDDAVDPPALCECVGAATRPCALLAGACAAGVETCAAGRWTMCSVVPVAEACNDVDDDCDGAVDEEVGTACWADPDGDGYAALDAAEARACGCPVGTTPREPVTGAIDCREGDAATHPGATELCDALDNDCSSGGGSEPAEDADGDGHARTGASCSGGPLPRDDCHDGEPDVHPGQDQWFSAPYCPAGLTFCGICPEMPAPRCRPAGCACSAAGASPTYDYDCDRFETPQPSDGASCDTTSGQLCSIDADCGSSGLAYEGSPACGSSISSISCRCGTGRACSARTTSIALGCR